MAMSDFEFLFALFGLLFGLVIAELAIKFADVIDTRAERPLGVLTPALAFLLLTDVTAFWLYIWSARHVLTVSWHTVFSGVLLAILYFIAAALVFPRGGRHWDSLDDHYWARKRLVVGAMLFVNVVVDGAMLTRAAPAWNDWWFYYYYVSYIAALAGLALSRSRRLDLVLLAWTIFMNVSEGFDLFPPSHFGAQVGLASAQMQQEAQH
jgi:hypothetical protein